MPVEDDKVETTDAISASATDPTDLSLNFTISSEVPTAGGQASHETIPAIHSYQIKPLLADRFKGGSVKEIMRNCMSAKLGGKAYDADHVKKWTVELANEINAKITELKLKRYKHIVRVTIIERKGAGVKSVVRCLWDAETDGYTSELFTSDTIVCLVVVYAVYLY